MDFIRGGLPHTSTVTPITRVKRGSGSLAPVVLHANPQRPFRGEGWGEGQTASPLRDCCSPHLTSPRNRCSKMAISKETLI